MNLARVGDIARQIRGVTYAKSEASREPRPGAIAVLRAGNITEYGVALHDLVYVPVGRVSKEQRIRAGDVLIAASSGSIDIVGKAAQAKRDLDCGFGAFCKVLRPASSVDPVYFGHYFRTRQYRTIIASRAAGANINNLRNEHLDDLLIPIPSMDEQRRIAAVLDHVDGLREQRRKAIALLDELAESTFLTMFSEYLDMRPETGSALRLADLADIASGITKGRKMPPGMLRELPYLAVANVQDRKLDLRSVKTIEVSDAEVERYSLREDDLLLTEGGDPDKLGRGVLWANEIPLCLHQNHIFRVRVKALDKVRPLYLNWLTASDYGKRYFFRIAKQTTGIASINKKQLSAFPVPVPPLQLQLEFERKLAAVRSQQDSARAHLAELDALFGSLQWRAFRGELWETSPA